jgi:hypothetical protein
MDRKVADMPDRSTEDGSTARKRFAWQRRSGRCDLSISGLKDIRHRYTADSGRWLPITAANGIDLFDMVNITATRTTAAAHDPPTDGRRTLAPRTSS